MKVLGSLLPFIVLIGFAYLVLIRPQMRQRQKQAALQSAVGPGQRIITTAGMHATVVEVDDEDGVLVLEVAPGVHCRYAKAAVLRVVDPVEPVEPVEPVVDEPPGIAEASAGHVDGGSVRAGGRRPRKVERGADGGSVPAT